MIRIFAAVVVFTLLSINVYSQRVIRMPVPPGSSHAKNTAQILRKQRRHRARLAYLEMKAMRRQRLAPPIQQQVSDSTHK